MSWISVNLAGPIQVRLELQGLSRPGRVAIVRMR
jgi:hypothetical protein